MVGQIDLHHFAEDLCAVDCNCQAVLGTLSQWGIKSEYRIFFAECWRKKVEVFLETESTISFPFIPTWPGIHKHFMASSPFLNISNTNSKVYTWRLKRANENWE